VPIYLLDEIQVALQLCLVIFYEFSKLKVDRVPTIDTKLIKLTPLKQLAQTKFQFPLIALKNLMVIQGLNEDGTIQKMVQLVVATLGYKVA